MLLSAERQWLSMLDGERDDRPPLALARRSDSPVSGDGEANAPVVLILPDNSRDPELTEVLRTAQEKHFARKHRR
jgi:hypothetical protein